ncbi:ABC transporter ATP-binding protein [Alicyclobacillus vulcanalis]|uniref:ABC-2 type transport system ATP-binding protein n=1 Tax=Alicyclobacillus vulcanalis TaxID=252246 RepID=A0A1N7NYW5_9BACL|nr:ABC transporter ATP-binding protein [Alicyclobacillus vulcanalis]SIT03523.1 ABC-2 type transport system ATP-binding protein [Alicyclobacillus vulcanalis]
MSNVLAVRNVSKQMGGRHALSSVSFSVHHGSIHALLGANGSGKTTMLRVLAGLYRPDAGEIDWMGQCVLPWADPAWRTELALVDPLISPPGRLTLEEWGALGARMYANWDEHRFITLITNLELPRKERIRRLSLGMLTQAKLAFALAVRPRLLLLDEPTTGLDPVVRRQMWQWLLAEIADAGTTAVLATHDIDDMEQLADSATVFFKGRAVWSGELEEAKAQFAKVVVRATGIRALASLAPAVAWQTSGHGEWSAMVERDALPALTAQLREAGVNQMMVQERLPLDEWFRWLMRREGYVRDSDKIS